VIFVDTSAIYAWVNSADPNHAAALARLDAALAARERLVTHNYVLLESLALVQARLGLTAATKLAGDAAGFAVEWVDEELHAAGVRELERSQRRQASLVDHISFLVMKRAGITSAFAFDPHFAAAGFRLFDA
jgi:predicted nucleic acid-binding protein